MPSIPMCVSLFYLCLFMLRNAWPSARQQRTETLSASIVYVSAFERCTYVPYLLFAVYLAFASFEFLLLLIFFQSTKLFVFVVVVTVHDII